MLSNCFNIFSLEIHLLSNKSFLYFLIIIYLLSFNSMYVLVKNYLKMFSSFLFHVLVKNYLKMFSNKSSCIIMPAFLSLFLMIFLTNFLGMMPYYFSFSSHISFSWPLALFFFLIIFFKICPKSLDKFIIHLVMWGIPLSLAPLLILIESVGIIIRPFTLSIRLSANMTAGHLIMYIIFLKIKFLILDMMIFMLLILIFFLEIFVSFIQSYVFTMLIILYNNEM